MKSKISRVNTSKYKSKRLTRGGGSCRSCTLCHIRMQKKPREWGLIAETRIRNFILKKDRVVYKTVKAKTEQKGEILFKDIKEIKPLNRNRNNKGAKGVNGRSYEITIVMEKGHGNPYRLANVGSKCKKRDDSSKNCSNNGKVNKWYRCLVDLWRDWKDEDHFRQSQIVESINNDFKKINEVDVKKKLPTIHKEVVKLDKEYQTLKRNIKELENVGKDIHKLKKNNDYENQYNFYEKFAEVKDNVKKDLVSFSKTINKTYRDVSGIGGYSGNPKRTIEPRRIPKATRLRKLKKKYSRDELRNYSVNELDALRRRIQAVKSAPIGRS